MNNIDDSTTGSCLIQTSPNIRTRCGEVCAGAGKLMSISKIDGKAYICRQDTIYKIPAGFLGADYPLTDDENENVTLIREGRIRGFSGLIPGVIYYPSCTVGGAISSNKGYDENIPAVGIAVSPNVLQICISYK